MSSFYRHKHSSLSLCSGCGEVKNANRPLTELGNPDSSHFPQLGARATYFKDGLVMVPSHSQRGKETFPAASSAWLYCLLAGLVKMHQGAHLVASGAEYGGDLYLDILLRCWMLAWTDFGLRCRVLVEKIYIWCFLCWRETAILPFLILLFSGYRLKSFRLIPFCLYSLSIILVQPSLRFLQHNRGKKGHWGMSGLPFACCIQTCGEEVLTKHSPQTLHAL